MKDTRDMLNGNVTKTLLNFAIPMIIGNLFQQLYNVADTVIVGKFIGPNALAAVGSSFSVMVLLTSIILGLCMGSGALFSYIYGSGDTDKLKNSFFSSFCFIGIIAVVINVLSLAFINDILSFIQIPQEILSDTKEYLQIVFYGIIFVFIYNYFAAVMRSMGNSIIPLLFLIIAAVINIILDIIFVVPLGMGIAGAAYATIIGQGFSALGIAAYSIVKVPEIHLQRKHIQFSKQIVKLIANYSILSSFQQSIMNFGILMIQGLVNSFGLSVMAAFAAAVKIDSFAYMPAQDFGNAFSTFIALNKGAGKLDRIHKGLRSVVKIITIYCAVISIFVIMNAKHLLSFFINLNEIEIINIGVSYLLIEGSFYCLIGYLFMFYGMFRGFGKPAVSIVLTIVSLGTRVLLAYKLSPISSIGILGIWWAIPIGWALADIVGVVLMRYYFRKLKD